MCDKELFIEQTAKFLVKRGLFLELSTARDFATELYDDAVSVAPKITEHKSSRGEAFDVPAPEPQVGADDPCYANTPYCHCTGALIQPIAPLGSRCDICNGLL